MAAAGRKASTVSLTYRALQQLTDFLVDEEKLPESPMARMKPPLVPEQPIPVLDDVALRRLLAVREARTWLPGGTARCPSMSASAAPSMPVRPTSWAWRRFPRELGDGDIRRSLSVLQNVGVRATLLLPPPVNVGAVIDGRDSETPSVAVDPVDDAEITPARGVKSGEFQVEFTTDSMRIFRKAAVNGFDDGGGYLFRQPS